MICTLKKIEFIKQRTKVVTTKEEQLDYLLEKRVFFMLWKLSLVSCCVVVWMLFSSCCKPCILRYLVIETYSRLENCRESWLSYVLASEVTFSRYLVVTNFPYFRNIQKNLISLWYTPWGWVKEKLIFTAVVPWLQNFEYSILIGRVYLAPARRLPWPFRSMHFGDV